MNSWNAIPSFILAALFVGACAPVASFAQDSGTAENLKRYDRINPNFTTKSGKQYETKAIQSVSPQGIAVLTSSGISRIKPADMPDDFRKLFKLTDEVLAKAQEAYARKRYDTKKAAARERALKDSVGALKQRYEMTVREVGEFGHFCDAVPLGDVAETVKVKVKPNALDRDQEIKEVIRTVKREQPIGQAQLMLVNGLSPQLKAGGTWKGDAWPVGVYTYEIEREALGTGSIFEEIPVAFINISGAIRYRAEIPADGSVGDSAAAGFAIATSGADSYILTSYRLVGTADRIEVTLPGGTRPVEATIVAKDAKEGLAVLKVRAPSKPAPFSRSSGAAKVGDQVFAVGFPDADIKDATAKKIEGIVGATSGERNDSRYLQLDGEFQPGTFGGAVFDETGTIIAAVVPNPAESFFLQEDGARYEPLQYAVKSTRFNNVLREVTDLKVGAIAPPADIETAAREAAVLVRVYRKKN